jgi:type IV secretion system protein VirD4
MADAAPGLLADLKRGDPDRPLEAFTQPDSNFTPMAKMAGTRALQYLRGGNQLFLGVVDGDAEKRDINGRRYVVGGREIGVDDDRHVITIAGSRAGKGRACIVPNMLQYAGSVLATDPKGELATITARQRSTFGPVHVLDPFGTVKDQSWPRRNNRMAGFNVVESMRPDSLVEDAALIADALVVVSEKDPHWDEAAAALIAGVVLHIRTWPGYEGHRSLLTLRSLIARGLPDKSAAVGYSLAALFAEMRKNTHPDAGDVVQAAADAQSSRPDNEAGSVLSSARRHLQFLNLFLKYGRQTLEGQSFELDDLKKRPTTIYLCLPARHVETCRGWLRLFVNLAMQSMERAGPGFGPVGRPVLFALDEFAALGHMKQIETAAGQIAGFGVRLWPVLQDLGQLKALYKDRWETFLGNAGVLQFFGNNDLTTLEWISRRLGKTSIQTLRKSDVPVKQRNAGHTGDSTGIEVHDLLTVDEAARLFGRDDPKLRQLVIWAGRVDPFMILQRVYYDKHGLFAGQFDEVPA